MDSDLPITDKTFASKFKLFEIDHPAEERIVIRHHFHFPIVKRNDQCIVYHRPPWAIYRTYRNWIYFGIPELNKIEDARYIAIFEHDHSVVDIYHRDSAGFVEGNNQSLSLFPTDRIILAQVLAHRNGCMFHSAGVIVAKMGYLFVGPSGAGKSTILKMFGDEVEVLCDDNVIVRKGYEGFNVHGTWNHGELVRVSNSSAPLKAIFFLKKDSVNRLSRICSKASGCKDLLGGLIKPLETRDWWENTLRIVNEIQNEVPSYVMHFDKSGKILTLLRHLN